MPANSSRFDSKIKRQQLIDDSKTHELLHTLEQHVQSRNTLTEEEWKQFEPLYQKDTPPNIRKELEKKMTERTSPFDPIRIVSDVGDKQGVHEVLFTLPPRLTPVNSINVAKIKTTQVVDSFVNSTEKPNPLNLKAEISTNQLLQVMSKTIRNDNARERTAKQVIVAEHLIEAAKGKQPDAEANVVPPEDESIDDFDFDSVPTEVGDDEIDDLDFDNDDTSLDDLEED